MTVSSNPEDVRAAVRSAAQNLLLAKGYEATTIRDISHQAKVSTGSIYHFFGSKDGVLASLIKEIFEGSGRDADNLRRPGDSAYLVLAYELVGQLKLISENQHLAELYAAAYRSWKITEVVLDAGTARNQSLFTEVLPSWGRQDFYIATSVIKGTLAVLVDERIHVNTLDLSRRIQVLLKATLPTFELPEQDFPKILSIALERIAV